MSAGRGVRDDLRLTSTAPPKRPSSCGVISRDVTNAGVVTFAEPGAFEDPLTEVLRCGARKLLADAIEAEVSDFLDRHSRFLTEEGQQRWFAMGICPSARS